MAELTFRKASPDDSLDLALLLDAASRRLASWFWGTMAAPGQSWFEVGRARIAGNSASPSHHANWQVAELGGRLAGGYYGFALPDPPLEVDLGAEPAPFRPMVEMEQTARGCWLLQAVALLPEHRGKGLGRPLIEHAFTKARELGHGKIALQVESPNTAALGLYGKCGFTEWERRPFVPFPGSDDTGDWVLMARDL